MAPILITSSLTRRYTLAALDKLATKDIMEKSGWFGSEKHFSIEAKGADKFEIRLMRPTRAGMVNFERYAIEISESSTSPQLNLSRIWDADQAMRVVVIAVSMVILPALLTVPRRGSSSDQSPFYFKLGLGFGFLFATLAVWWTITGPSECKKFLEVQLGALQKNVTR